MCYSLKKAQVPLGMENGRYAFTRLVSSTIAVTILWSYLVSPMANRIGLKVSSGGDPDTAKIIKLSLLTPNRNQRLSLTALLSHIKFMQTRARETISALLVSGLLRCFMVSRLSSPLWTTSKTWFRPRLGSASVNQRFSSFLVSWLIA